MPSQSTVSFVCVYYQINSSSERYHRESSGWPTLGLILLDFMLGIFLGCCPSPPYWQVWAGIVCRAPEWELSWRIIQNLIAWHLMISDIWGLIPSSQQSSETPVFFQASSASVITIYGYSLYMVKGLVCIFLLQLRPLHIPVVKGS